MNEKTLRRLFPKVELSVCPYNIQNFGNSTADIYILGQFRTYLQFRGRKYLNTFIVTNANDCPNILSHGATFRMGVLIPNYPEENVVKGDKVPNLKIGTPTSTLNVFQILQDLRLKQYQGNSEPKAYRPSTTCTTSTAKQLKVSMTHGTASQKVGTAIYIDNMSPTLTPCRTMPSPKPIPHTVQDNQPMKYTKIPHTVDLQLVVCMYTSCRVKSVSRENRQP